MLARRNEMAVLVGRMLTVIDPRALSVGELNGICRSFDAVECSNPEIVNRINGYTAAKCEYERLRDHKVSLSNLPHGHIPGQTAWNFSVVAP